MELKGLKAKCKLNKNHVHGSFFVNYKNDGLRKVIHKIIKNIQKAVYKISILKYYKDVQWYKVEESGGF